MMRMLTFLLPFPIIILIIQENCAQNASVTVNTSDYNNNPLSGIVTATEGEDSSWVKPTTGTVIFPFTVTGIQSLDNTANIVIQQNYPNPVQDETNSKVQKKEKILILHLKMKMMITKT